MHKEDNKFTSRYFCHKIVQISQLHLPIYSTRKHGLAFIPLADKMPYDNVAFFLNQSEHRTVQGRVTVK